MSISSNILSELGGFLNLPVQSCASNICVCDDIWDLYFYEAFKNLCQCFLCEPCLSAKPCLNDSHIKALGEGNSRA